MIDSSSQFHSRVGIEISVNALNAVVIGEDNAIVLSRTIPVGELENSIPQIVGLVDELKNEIGGFDRLGIAVPGLIDRDTGRVTYSANLSKLVEVELVNNIKDAVNMDVVIENDANAAAFGEYSCGAGRGSQNLFYVTLGEGVGGAFIFGGEIWRGASGFAGEFGYVPINSEGMRLEDVASTANIIRRTRARFHQDSTSSLSKIDEAQIKLTDIITAAKHDDDFAQLMLERTGMFVGAVVASVINLVNVEKIIVGGEIMTAKSLVLDAILDRAQELSFAPSFDSTSIVEGELGGNAAAVGVALISGRKTT